MFPLAFNSRLLETFRTRIQVTLFVLPVGLMFLSIAPTLLYARWIADSLEISLNEPASKDPNSLLWFTGFISVMMLLMVVGGLLGWVANALVSRYVLGWSSSQVIAVYMRSEVPHAWFKPSHDSISEKRAILAAVRKWKEYRTIGPIRFILTRGVLPLGMLMFIFMMVPTFFRGAGFDLETVIYQAALCGVAGGFLGAVLWWLSEWEYRKRQ